MLERHSFSCAIHFADPAKWQLAHLWQRMGLNDCGFVPHPRKSAKMKPAVPKNALVHVCLTASALALRRDSASCSKTDFFLCLNFNLHCLHHKKLSCPQKRWLRQLFEWFSRRFPCRVIGGSLLLSERSSSRPLDDKCSRLSR